MSEVAAIYEDHQAHVVSLIRARQEEIAVQTAARREEAAAAIGGQQDKTSVSIASSSNGDMGGRSDRGSAFHKKSDDEATSKTLNPTETAGAEAQEKEKDAPPPGTLTEEQQKTVDALKARDIEVRNHEQAHQRTGGQYASSPSYTFQSGPDGQQYAIGGEVQIDVSPVDGDPQATIEKMTVVKAAALAPAEPSGADRQVAALADRLRTQAMADLALLRAEELRGEPKGDSSSMDIRA